MAVEAYATKMKSTLQDRMRVATRAITQVVEKECTNIKDSLKQTKT